MVGDGINDFFVFVVVFFGIVFFFGIFIVIEVVDVVFV